MDTNKKPNQVFYEDNYVNVDSISDVKRMLNDTNTELNSIEDAIVKMDTKNQTNYAALNISMNHIFYKIIEESISVHTQIKEVEFKLKIISGILILWTTLIAIHIVFASQLFK